MALHLNPDKEITKAYVQNNCSFIANAIESNYETLIATLLTYESYETAKDEVWRSLNCLRNISKELEWLTYGKVDLMCTIFPVNLPLYSLIIFALVPGFMANELVVRPPVLTRDIVQKIWDLLNLSAIIRNIKFVDMERNLFTEAFISVADVVMFTGRYENAKNIQQACPDALFIFNGAGVNPVIVTDTAEIDLAADKTVEMRVFNSGQDCAGSDLILVHEKILDKFKNKIFSKLNDIKIGDYRDRNVRIGPIIKVDQLLQVKNFFTEHKESIVFGGGIDFSSGIVNPTVIIEDMDNISTFKMTEFFAPIFYILIYHNDNDLEKYFSNKNYSDYAMYVSLFGNSSYAPGIPNTIILNDKIVNDVERGNNPYGGFGPKANYVRNGGVYYNRPILISYEIFTLLQEQEALTHSLVQ